MVSVTISIDNYFNMNRRILFIAIWALFILFSNCRQHIQIEQPQGEQISNSQSKDKNLAKFEPEDGKCILFVGQELSAIGGLEEYNDGYFDHFQNPGGFTMYTNFSPGDTMFGYVTKGLDGLETTDNWGDSASNMSLQLKDEDFRNSALAIGLWMVNHEEEVADGLQDQLIDRLGQYLKKLGHRPVFLRIGYEFGGEWNHYDRQSYLAAYRRIKDRYDAAGINNVAYVWQSHGWGMSQEELEGWYPGDEYVDWCAYSFFSRFDEVEMIEFARKKGKPVFIAEASATISTPTVKIDGKTKETILSDPEQGEEAWEKWFIPFFRTIEENEDVIKAVSYINCHWKANPMWYDNPTFQDVDARLQTNPEIARKWKEKTEAGRFLHASDTLFTHLWRTQDPAN